MPNSTVLAVAMLLIAVWAALLGTGCAEDEPAQQHLSGDDALASSASAPSLGEKALDGEGLFKANCSVCHGIQADGTTQGPPLVHIYYEPGHHGDFAFYSAAQNGVPIHHWQFGDMPPVDTVSTEDMDKIICYVRTLQRSAGITDRIWC